MKQTAMASTGAGRGTFRSYCTGFILSIVLTLVAFGMVLYGQAMSRKLIFGCVLVAAVIQILLHLHYFLHLGSTSNARWNILALAFTALIMILFIGGSLWIMSDLNHRMM